MPTGWQRYLFRGLFRATLQCMLSHSVDYVRGGQQLPTKSNRRRVQLDFSPEAYERLMELQRESGAPSNADLMRNAIRLFEWLVERHRDGYRVQLTNRESGQLREVEFAFLPESIGPKPLSNERVEDPAEPSPDEARSDSAEPRTVSNLSLELIDSALYRALLAHPELLRTLHWRTFEALLADVLSTFGYDIELCRGTKDGGVDIFALKRVDSLGPHLYLLQAKRSTHSVGVAPVRQLMFVHSEHKATKSCLATTSHFTSGAWELAHRYRWQLALRDFEGLRELIERAYNIKVRLQ